MTSSRRRPAPAGSNRGASGPQDRPRYFLSALLDCANRRLFSKPALRMTSGPIPNSDQHSQHEREDRLHRKRSHLILFAGGAVLVFFLAAYFLEFGLKLSLGLSGHPNDWSSFGEYIGGSVGAFIAFLALWLLVQTMEIQVRELTHSRKAMESSAESLKTQIKISEAQRRDETYFHILSHFNETMSHLSADAIADRPPLTGRVVLAAIYDELEARAGGNRDMDVVLGELEAIEARFERQSEYFLRAATLLLDYVDAVMGEEKRVCGARFRAQLTDSETCLLYYLARLPRGARMRELADELLLFEPIPTKRLIHAEHAPSARL